MSALWAMAIKRKLGDTWHLELGDTGKARCNINIRLDMPRAQKEVGEFDGYVCARCRKWAEASTTGGS